MMFCRDCFNPRDCGWSFVVDAFNTNDERMDARCRVDDDVDLSLLPSPLVDEKFGLRYNSIMRGELFLDESDERLEVVRPFRHI